MTNIPPAHHGHRFEQTKANEGPQGSRKEFALKDKEKEKEKKIEKEEAKGEAPKEGFLPVQDTTSKAIAVVEEGKVEVIKEVSSAQMDARLAAAKEIVSNYVTDIEATNKGVALKLNENVPDAFKGATVTVDTTNPTGWNVEIQLVSGVPKAELELLITQNRAALERLAESLFARGIQINEINFTGITTMNVGQILGRQIEPPTKPQTPEGSRDRPKGEDEPRDRKDGRQGPG